MLAKRILPRGGLLVCLMLPVGLFSQTSPPPKKTPAPTGLKILSTTLDPKTHNVTVQVQNVTNDKTVVAYALRFRDLDKDGKEISDTGGAIDHAGPNSDTQNFILPGQISSIGLFQASPEAVSVEATITGLVYEDRTWEGTAAQMFFMTRARRAQEARKQAVEATGDRKAELERQAKWYEDHSPKEAQQ